MNHVVNVKHTENMANVMRKTGRQVLRDVKLRKLYSPANINRR
jgi:hypothetical protein